MSPASQVLFLNPDGVLASDALARMVEVFEYSETIGIVGGLLCNPDESEQLGGRRGFPTRKRAFIGHLVFFAWPDSVLRFFLTFLYTKSRCRGL